jgi:hypothetical protein
MISVRSGSSARKPSTLVSVAFSEIVGHERQGVAQQVYFKEGHTLAQKREAIEKFEV